MIPLSDFCTGCNSFVVKEMKCTKGLIDTSNPIYPAYCPKFSHKLETKSPVAPPKAEKPKRVIVPVPKPKPWIPTVFGGSKAPTDQPNEIGSPKSLEVAPAVPDDKDRRIRELEDSLSRLKSKYEKTEKEKFVEQYLDKFVNSIENFKGGLQTRTCEPKLKFHTHQAKKMIELGLLVKEERPFVVTKKLWVLSPEAIRLVESKTNPKENPK